MISQKRLYSCKMVAIGQSGSNRSEVIVFRQSGCIRAKWFIGEKMVVFGQSGCIRAKVVVFEQRGFTGAKVVVIG